MLGAGSILLPASGEEGQSRFLLLPHLAPLPRRAALLHLPFPHPHFQLQPPPAGPSAFLHLRGVLPLTTPFMSRDSYLTPSTSCWMPLSVCSLPPSLSPSLSLLPSLVLSLSIPPSLSPSFSPSLRQVLLRYSEFLLLLSPPLPSATGPSGGWTETKVSGEEAGFAAVNHRGPGSTLAAVLMVS